ncbi:MAG TPA: efflux RND transporter periplasmic adaptor subunit [Panacibacter sp.]|mgnify:FL=1|nr:efflux RND transporter periplasmic adaptor subunit [Panacibacter sp.]HNP47089.1 efflux RND transporter periplasmic adaptor subunit [Panacibacter sp.]
MKNIIFGSIILFISCAGSKSPDESTAAPGIVNTVTLTDAQVKNAGIVTGKTMRKEISSILKLNGIVDVPPQNMVSISVPLGGYLRSTSLLPGMHVRKGDVIAVMEDQQYIQLQQDYLTAKAKIGFLRNEYERQKDLNSSQASSDKVYQQAEADYKTQQVLIAALAEKLKLAGINVEQLNETNISRSVNIYSPINGYVSQVNINVGKYVTPAEVLFELVNPDDIHLALKVFEKDLDKLFIGQQLVCYTNNNPGKKYNCEVLLIGKDLSIERNTDVHCHFETYDKSLIPGTYMNATVEVKSNDAYTLPEDAVVRFENKHYVFLKKGGNEFQMTEVTVGNTENGFIEILNAEDFASQELAIRGAYSILMSLKNKSEE